MSFEEFLSNASTGIPEFFSTISSYVPVTLDLMPMLKFALIFSAIVLFFGFFTRTIFGRRSSLNRSVSCAIAILIIYVVTICIYTFKPWNLSEYISPLPFVLFSGDYLVIMPFRTAAFAEICGCLLSTIILAFLVNLADTVTPVGTSTVGWFATRIVMVALAMVLHLAMSWVLNKFMPSFIMLYAPVILLIILVAFLLLGISKLILGLVLSTIHPLIGIVYTFFFSNMIGKQITKSIFSTILICIFFYFLEYFGYIVILITEAALIAYVPLLVALLVLWYLLGYEL